jgi:cyanophycinase
LPTASGDPLKNGSLTVEALRAAGADAYLVPVWLAGPDADYKSLVTDPALVEQVKTASGVYFIGGSQERITAALGTGPGQRTPMLEAVWDVYHRGGVIAGTSAGAAVMSRMMFRRSASVLKTLEEGVQLGNELAPGLGFLDPGWFVEQHCLARGRFGRSLVAMKTLDIKYGVGIDESTAVVVERGRAMSILGDSGTIVMDLSQASVDPSVKGFNLKNAKLTYLCDGDGFDLQSLEVSPSPLKLSDRKIDPNSDSFQPARDDSIVVTDILGRTVLVDLIVKLIDNKQPEAIGLAFDAALARAGKTAGFEFRFYRAVDSIGWHSQTAPGPAAYTVANIHLDVRPIEVGPLYK